MPAANTGLTISGTNVAEFDAVFQAAYEQYKVGYDKILMSSRDVAAMASFFAGSGPYRFNLEADKNDGRIVAGRRITAYHNKWFSKDIDIEIHPWVPQGTVIFWSNRSPYELAGVGNILEAMVRQDYYQISWALRTRRYEFGVYVDEMFVNYFTPGFGVIRNLNLTAGTPSFSAIWY